MLRDDRLGFSRWLQISVSLQLKAFPRIGGAAASALAGSTVVEFTGDVWQPVDHHGNAGMIKKKTNRTGKEKGLLASERRSWCESRPSGVGKPGKRTGAQLKHLHQKVRSYQDVSLPG